MALAILLLLPLSVKAQTVAPISGLGNIQFFDNSGTLLTSGVLYSYQAGTSTQQATFTDSSGTTQNPNPIPFGSGARVQIWLSIGSFYKLVLCTQNDGVACAAGDILFTVDNVPGGSTSSGGSSSSPFISGSASPATSGILRLASGDTVCYRNSAGSANICLSKDANDLLTWAGGSLKLPEVGAPTCSIGFDVIWADNTAHRPKVCGNGGGAAQLAIAGIDISTSDTVTGLHFGSSPAPISSSAPTTNQYLRWDGSNIVGSAVDSIMNTAVTISGATGVCAAGTANCPIYILPIAHTLTRLVTNTSSAPSGCAPNAVFGVKDLTSSTVLASLTPTVLGVLDSGALSVSMMAGHQFAIGVTTTAAGCGVFAGVAVTATYQ